MTIKRSHLIWLAELTNRFQFEWVGVWKNSFLFEKSLKKIISILAQQLNNNLNSFATSYDYAHVNGPYYLLWNVVAIWWRKTRVVLNVRTNVEGWRCAHSCHSCHFSICQNMLRTKKELSTNHFACLHCSVFVNNVGE